MTVFILILVAIFIYELFVYAVSRNRVAVIEAKPESIVVLFRWLLRLSFGLNIALLTLSFAIWGTVMYDQSDPYTSGLTLGMISIPGIVLVVVAMLLGRVALSGIARRITLISLFVVGICFAWGGIMGRSIATGVV